MFIEIKNICIASNHNAKIIEKELNALKQLIKENGKLYLYDKDGNSFAVITPDTKVITCETIEERGRT